jgi:hypothetical protein
VASTGAKDGAKKIQSPTPKAQVKDEAENDEVPIPNVGTSEDEMVGHTISQSLGLSRGALA